MRPIIFCLVIALLFGCASSMSSSSSGSSNRITAEEIRNCGASNAYDAITTLRPGLIQKMQRKADANLPRGGSTFGSDAIVIYFNSARRTGIQSLQEISTMNLAEIIYVEPTTATMRYGTGHAGGALIINTTR